MEMEVLPLLMFLLLAASGVCNHSLAAAEAVLDVNGKPVLAGRSYTIRVIMPDGSNQSVGPEFLHCHAILSSGLGPGNWVRFLPADPAAKIIQTSADLNVVFNTTRGGNCGNKNGWWVERELPLFNQYVPPYVYINRSPGNPSIDTANRWFKIDKHLDDSGVYMFVYNPTVCGGNTTCPHVEPGYVIVRNSEPYISISRPYNSLHSLHPLPVVFLPD